MFWKQNNLIIKEKKRKLKDVDMEIEEKGTNNKKQ